MLNPTPKTILTLSAVPEHQQAADRTRAVVERTRLCAVCGGALFLTWRGAWDHVTQPVETETELRLAWGDR